MEAENIRRAHRVREICEKYQLGIFQRYQKPSIFKYPPAPQYAAFYIDRWVTSYSWLDVKNIKGDILYDWINEQFFIYLYIFLVEPYTVYTISDKTVIWKRKLSVRYCLYDAIMNLSCIQKFQTKILKLQTSKFDRFAIPHFRCSLF